MPSQLDIIRTPLVLVQGDDEKTTASPHEVNCKQWDFVHELRGEGVELDSLLRFLKDNPDKTLYQLSDELNYLREVAGESEQANVRDLIYAQALVGHIIKLYSLCKFRLKLKPPQTLEVRLKKQTQFTIVNDERLSVEDKRGLLAILERYSTDIEGLNIHSAEAITRFEEELNIEKEGHLHLLRESQAVVVAITSAPSYRKLYGNRR